MFILLLALAGIPLLGLETLRWYHKTGNRRILRKAFRLAFAASVFWSLLGDYISTVYVGWLWLFYSLMAVGAGFTGLCAWYCFAKHRSRSRTLMAVLAFICVFILVDWLVPDAVWLDFHDQEQAFGLLSRLHGPLR